MLVLLLLLGGRRKGRGEVEGGEKAAQLRCAVRASLAGVKKLHKLTALDSAAVRAACERAPPRENWRSLRCERGRKGGSRAAPYDGTRLCSVSRTW